MPPFVDARLLVSNRPGSAPNVHSGRSRCSEWSDDLYASYEGWGGLWSWAALALALLSFPRIEGVLIFASSGPLIRAPQFMAPPLMSRSFGVHLPPIMHAGLTSIHSFLGNGLLALIVSISPLLSRKMVPSPPLLLFNGPHLGYLTAGLGVGPGQRYPPVIREAGLAYLCRLYRSLRASRQSPSGYSLVGGGRISRSWRYRPASSWSLGLGI